MYVSTGDTMLRIRCVYRINALEEISMERQERKERDIGLVRRGEEREIGLGDREKERKKGILCWQDKERERRERRREAKVGQSPLSTPSPVATGEPQLSLSTP